MAMQKKGKLKSYRFFSVLDKMIVADLAKTLCSVLLVIVVIIVSRKFIKVLAKAIEGSISNETVLNILGLKTLIAIGAFLPVSIFIAILMVLGRMYRDQEMAAIASAGGGAGAIYHAVFILIFPLCFIAGGLSLFATPWAEAEINTHMHEDLHALDTRNISAGRFSEYKQGELVFYTEKLDSNGKMYNVFVQNRAQSKLGIVTAKYGRMEYLPGGFYLILEHGERLQGIPGEVNYIIEKFDEYAVRLEKKTTAVFQRREAQLSTRLWASNDVLDTAEIQKRLSIPLGILFLSFLAVPLAKLSPRSGVYGSLGIAFAIYFIYGNLNRVSYSWVANKVIPVSVGYLWVHLVLLLLGCALLLRLYGVKWVVNSIRHRGEM